MKFGNGRRNHKEKSTKSVVHFKTLMTGKQTMAVGALVVANNGGSPTTTTKENNNSSPKSKQQSTQILVNSSASLRGTSIEFTTIDPTEAVSITSISTTGLDSFVVACDYSLKEDEDEVSTRDPYLDFGFDATHHHQQKASKSGSPTSQDEIFGTVMSKKKKKNFNNKATSPIVSFKTLSGGHFNPTTKSAAENTEESPHRKEGESQRTPDTFEESNPAEEEEVRISPSPITKLTSLGTFDFPAAAEEKVQSNSKSLGGGCFEIPPEETRDENDSSQSPSGTAEALGFASPLSAISKGLKAIGTLALPRALQFDLLARQQPPSTPVSQSNSPENPRRMARMTQLRLQSDQDCDYWNGVVTKLVKTHGKCHAKTAEGFLQLGHSYMLNRDYAQAVIAFQSACRIWKQLQKSKEDQLAFARVVDAIGCAWGRVTQDEDKDHCRKAMAALEEAFQIRYDLLGPWHPDTVESLNKIASVHMHLREYKEACNAYWEVFWVRKAIFGSDHPSVAIAAHALGNVFLHLADTRDAANFFQFAVDIYERMDLPNKHPAVVRLMRDYKRLDRICLTSRIPRQERLLHR